jgi:hypothetical protein
MSSILHQALLVLAAAALGGAALRLASLAAPRGLERLVAAAPIAMTAAVAEALALGLVGLSGSSLALALAAGATWLLARAFLPAPALTAHADARTAFADRGLPAVALLGAAAGFAVWALWRPFLGYDGATYHLSTVVRWVQTGSTGSVQDLIVGLPVGNYPLTNETGLAWAVGISHSFAPVALWSAGTALLLTGSAWLGLRSLSVPRAARAIAILALCATPVVLRQLVEVGSDLPALSWLAASGALAVTAQRRPPLVALSLLAACLAVGTKTTVAPIALIVVALGLLPLRRNLRALVKPLTAALVAGALVGGLWYLRNLVQHGSPLWPLVATPWGDPVPRLIGDVGHSLLERPQATFRTGVGSAYLDSVAGGLVLLAAALTAPLWGRSRATLLGAGATLVALLAWASAPFTGAPESHALGGIVFSTLRYALPALGVAATTVALGACRGRRAARVSAGFGVVAVAWSAYRYADDPYLPGEALLAACVVTGAAVAAALLHLRRRMPAAAPAALVAAALVVALSLGSDGYLERHARAGEIDAPLIAWLSAHSDWGGSRLPVAVVPTLLATVAGDRLEHRLDLIAADASCDSIRTQTRSGFVLTAPAPRAAYPPVTFERCLAATAPSFTAESFRIYRRGAASR